MNDRQMKPAPRGSMNSNGDGSGGGCLSAIFFGLASALKKISLAAKRVPLQASPSTAHMFIVNPLSGQSLMSLFSTHPPVEERVKRLVGEHAALYQTMNLTEKEQLFFKLL